MKKKNIIIRKNIVSELTHSHTHTNKKLRKSNRLNIII